MALKTSLKEQDTCFISFGGKPTKAYISDGLDRNGYYMVVVPDGGLCGLENAELPVHESLVFDNLDSCYEFYIAEQKAKLIELERLRASESG